MDTVIPGVVSTLFKSWFACELVDFGLFTDTDKASHSNPNALPPLSKVIKTVILNSRALARVSSIQRSSAIEQPSFF